jgi:SAM-dependent methyltransferase
MSSPLAKPNKTGLDQALILAHQKLSHSKRTQVLAGEFTRRIRALGLESAKILDVGCGDLSLARALSEAIPRITINGIDIHSPPDCLASVDPIWSKYQQFDGETIPHDPNSFDVILFSDVLHHVPERLRQSLLRSAGQVGRFVLIKDHFEYGWISRQMLRAMDFVGNYGYGISVPDRYFDVTAFTDLVTRADLAIKRLDVGIRLYDHLPLIPLLFSAEWQFIAICQGHCNESNDAAFPVLAADPVSPPS